TRLCHYSWLNTRVRFAYPRYTLYTVGWVSGAHPPLAIKITLILPRDNYRTLFPCAENIISGPM
ncbi:hypothetical protein, partial [Cronobacter sakazakii]